MSNDFVELHLTTPGPPIAGRSEADVLRSLLNEAFRTLTDVVASMVGDETSLQERLAGSAARFERLSSVEDVTQIHAQLFEEVATLKRISVERRAAWDERSEQFASRLATLESQLDSTRREAAIDPLTNIANRRTFERTCRQWLAPNRPGFVMAMADVDNFKAINDQFGHAVGDQVLVGVAETLARCLRSDDLVARVGGDEFAILATSLSLGQAESRFAAIAAAVERACRVFVPDGVAPSISIGLAERSAGDTSESLTQRADEALYQAKKSGKGRLATKASPFIRDLLM